MLKLLIIALGGALGSVCRFLASEGVYQLLGRGFPFGILFVNVLGSFIMGALTVILVHKYHLSDYWRMAILVGFLGGFTTFSSFSIDAVNLLQHGEFLKTLIYILASVLLSVSAAYLGVFIFSR